MRNHSPLIFFVVIVLPLAGCASAEARLRADLEAANRCETPADCVLIGSKCPFDCYIYAHKDEAVRMTAALDAYPSACEYSCIASSGVDCVQGKCQAITE
jgi:hypothetical protein